MKGIGSGIHCKLTEKARLLTETDRCLAGDSVCGAGRQGNRRKQRKGEDGTSLFTLFISVSSVSSCKNLSAYWFPGQASPVWISEDCRKSLLEEQVIAGLQRREPAAENPNGDGQKIAILLFTLPVPPRNVNFAPARGTSPSRRSSEAALAQTLSSLFLHY